MEKLNQVRELANYVRNNPNNAVAVADALDVIASALIWIAARMGANGCEDCGSQQVSLQKQIGVDAPDVGADTKNTTQQEG